MKPDCAWLAEFSDGEIVYDDVELPMLDEAPEFGWLAEPLMGMLREELVELRMQKQAFRRLFRGSVGREQGGPELARFLRSATDEQFLNAAATNFRQIDHGDDAKACDDVAQQLADNA